jgi:type IV pilus assembly protein PilQ
MRKIAVSFTLLCLFGAGMHSAFSEDIGVSSSSSADDESLKDLERAVEKEGSMEETELSEAEPEAEAPIVDLAPEKEIRKRRPVAGEDGPSTRPRAEIAQADDRPAYKNEISNVEFKNEGGVSRIVITARHKIFYRQSNSPSTKQIVFLFENTTIPQRLQRAFDTTEFQSPVSLFTVLQMPRTEPPLSKLIVQLREESEASVNNTDEGLLIEFPYSSKAGAEPRIVKTDDTGRANEDNIYSGAQTYSGQVIKKLEIKNSDVQDVLRLIARTSGYNVVVGDDVSGKVGTLSLENLPWDQAFALVLQSKKLGYVRQGNVLRVGTLTNLKQEKEEALANEQSRIKVEPLRTVLIPISYARAGDIAPRARGFATERGSVDVDDRTNTVIVRDINSVVERVQKLVAALDIQPPRVAISGKIVEMSSQFTRDVGLNNVRFQENLAGIDLTQTVNTSASIASNSTTISAPRFAGLSARFALGELDSSVKVLANPSVSVVANQQASINSTFTLNRPIPATPASGSTPAQPGGFASFPATLSLAVTPIVAGDGSIFMNVAVKNDTLTPKDNDVTVNSRSMSTQVLIENGDTAVIGGLFQSTYTQSKSGLAYLMRIPILGFLFSGSNMSDISTEIFVFLTAKIMNTDEAFRRNL